MTSADKKTFLLQFRKFQSAREIFYKPKIQKILQEQVNQYVEHNSLHAIDFKPLFDQLVQLYRNTAVVWGHKVHLTIKRQQVKSKQPIGFSARIYEILKSQYGIDLLKDAMDITQTTKDLIQRVLTDAAAQGFGINEIVKRVKSPEFTDARARKIARTETVAAANIAGDIVATESGLTMNKEWLAVLDNRTRIDHEQVHGTNIPQAMKFSVGGNPMRFPGDRGADGNITPANETINCRCVCVYIPKVKGV